MNISLIFYILGYVLIFEAGFLSLPALVGLIYLENTGWIYFVVALVTLAFGIGITRFKPTKKTFYAKEGFATVSLSWILISLVGALPFVISGEIPHYIDALFEIVSGFSTTGGSILTNVEALSHPSLFWRSFSHWVGGMGILVFILAIVPLFGATNIHLMKAESPGPIVGKLVPKVKKTAFYLYAIYIALTLIEAIFLICGKVPLFDALTLAFGTAGTGGFAVTNSGLGGYSIYAQIVVTIFMFLFGINFSTYYLLLTKHVKEAFFEEVRVYIAMVFIAIIAITINVAPLFDNVGQAILHSSFQVTSLVSSTGFATTDFNLWPSLSKTILVILMFVGACGGSTGGGTKVSRICIAFKSGIRRIVHHIYPKKISSVKMDGKALDDETVSSIGTYFIVYFFVFAISLLLISFNNFDFTTNVTSVLATLNNIGPGLEMVGPMGNYSAFSYFSKIVLIFDMLIGRLEIYPMLILFSPKLWRKM